MSSFQFPANPSDGDIVVRGDLQAFYNAATNTWRVSQVPTAPGIPGPPGPPGPIGPPGQGVAISGAVATFADLPAPNAAQFEFWLVDDTNEIYWSDGLTWTNLGGPIQGPQGEKGEDGNNGTNGQNGRGWYDTEILTDNDEYRVRFLSNDGLTFTTDNLKGPQGDAGQNGQDGQDFTGNIPIATKTTVGVVRIGEGIDIDPGGSGEISVDLDTVDLETESGGSGTSSYSLPYTPSYGLATEQGFKASNAYVSNLVADVQTMNISVPPTSNGAIVYYFTTSRATPFVSSSTNLGTSSQIVASLDVSGGNADWEDGLALANNMTHNMTSNTTQSSRVQSINPVMKVGRVSYDVGTTQLTFTQTTQVQKLFRQNVYYGTSRVVLQPYRDDGSFTRTIQNIHPFYTEQEIVDSKDFEFVHDGGPTEDELKTLNSEFLKQEINYQTSHINDLLANDYPNDATLISYRQDLHNLRLLSGTYEDVWTALDTIVSNINSYSDYQFQFEV